MSTRRSAPVGNGAESMSEDDDQAEQTIRFAEALENRDDCRRKTRNAYREVNLKLDEVQDKVDDIPVDSIIEHIERTERLHDRSGMLRVLMIFDIFYCCIYS